MARIRKWKRFLIGKSGSKCGTGLHAGGPRGANSLRDLARSQKVQRE